MILDPRKMWELRMGRPMMAAYDGSDAYDPSSGASDAGPQMFGSPQTIHPAMWASVKGQWVKVPAFVAYGSKVVGGGEGEGSPTTVYYDQNGKQLTDPFQDPKYGGGVGGTNYFSMNQDGSPGDLIGSVSGGHPSFGGAALESAMPYLALLATGGFAAAGAGAAGAAAAGAASTGELGSLGAVGGVGSGAAGAAGGGTLADLADAFNAGATGIQQPGLMQLASNAGTVDAGAGGLGSLAGPGYANASVPSIMGGTSSTGGLSVLGNPALGFNATPAAVGAFDSGIGAGLAGSLALPSTAAANAISTNAATGAGLASGSNAAGSFLGEAAGGVPAPAGSTTLSNFNTGTSGGPNFPSTSTAATTAAKTALSKVLDGTATAQDYAQLAGQALPGLLGAYGASQQAGALSDLADKYWNAGAPSRSRYEASMTPGFDPTSIPGYAGALDTTSQSVLRKLSATGGNPYGNPGALEEANKYIVNSTALPAIQNYQNQNAASGGFSALTSAYNPTATQSIASNSGMLSALGSAGANVLNPSQGQDTLASWLKQLAAMGGTNNGISGSSLA